MNTVHTAGINWESVGTLVLAFVVAVGGAARWIISRVDRKRARTEKFVTEKVDQVAGILDVKLSSITEHLGSQDAKIDDTRDRVLHIEGKLSSHS